MVVRTSKKFTGTSAFLMASSTLGRRARALPRLVSLLFKSCAARGEGQCCPHGGVERNLRLVSP